MIDRNVAMRPTHPEHDFAMTEHRCRRVSLVLIVLLAAATGCQSTRYQARSLPAELTARSMNAMPPIDLSRLSTNRSINDRIYPGDTLGVTVATGIEQKPPTPWLVRVTPQGVANVPEVGPVQLTGLSYTEAEEMIRRESIQRQLYVSPHVSVSQEQRRTYRITVMGAVEEGGSFEIPAPACDLATVLLEAKGLADDHSGIVLIKQPRTLEGSPVGAHGVGLASFEAPSRSSGRFHVSRIDLTNVPENALANMQLADGSVVEVVPQDPRTIRVLGLVTNPGRYKIAPDEEARLTDALALAGGRTLQIADKVHIVRQAPGENNPVVIEASLRRAMEGSSDNILLASGDVVHVKETPTTFTVGMLQKFIRVGFSSSIPCF